MHYPKVRIMNNFEKSKYLAWELSGEVWQKRILSSFKFLDNWTLQAMGAEISDENQPNTMNRNWIRHKLDLRCAKVKNQIGIRNGRTDSHRIRYIRNRLIIATFYNAILLKHYLDWKFRKKWTVVKIRARKLERVKIERETGSKRIERVRETSWDCRRRGLVLRLNERWEREGEKSFARRWVSGEVLGPSQTTLELRDTPVSDIRKTSSDPIRSDQTNQTLANGSIIILGLFYTFMSRVVRMKFELVNLLNKLRMKTYLSMI